MPARLPPIVNMPSAGSHSSQTAKTRMKISPIQKIGVA